MALDPVALGLEAQKPGQEEGPAQVGPVRHDEDPALEVGLEEEEVLVGVPALAFAEEGLPWNPPGQKVPAPRLPLAHPVPRGPSPGHGDPGGQALAVEGQGGLEAALKDRGGPSPVLGRPQDHNPVVPPGLGQGEEEKGPGPEPAHALLIVL